MTSLIGGWAPETYRQALCAWVEDHGISPYDVP
jgi:hypothetical protein